MITINDNCDKSSSDTSRVDTCIRVKSTKEEEQACIKIGSPQEACITFSSTFTELEAPVLGELSLDCALSTIGIINFNPDFYYRFSVSAGIVNFDPSGFFIWTLPRVNVPSELFLATKVSYLDDESEWVTISPTRLEVSPTPQLEGSERAESNDVHEVTIVSHDFGIGHYTDIKVNTGSAYVDVATGIVMWDVGLITLGNEYTLELRGYYDCMSESESSIYTFIGGLRTDTPILSPSPYIAGGCENKDFVITNYDATAIYEQPIITHDGKINSFVGDTINVTMGTYETEKCELSIQATADVPDIEISKEGIAEITISYDSPCTSCNDTYVYFLPRTLSYYNLGNDLTSGYYPANSLEDVFVPFRADFIGQGLIFDITTISSSVISYSLAEDGLRFKAYANSISQVTAIFDITIKHPLCGDTILHSERFFSTIADNYGSSNWDSSSLPDVVPDGYIYDTGLDNTSSQANDIFGATYCKYYDDYPTLVVQFINVYSEPITAIIGIASFNNGDGLESSAFTTKKFTILPPLI